MESQIEKRREACGIAPKPNFFTRVRVGFFLGRILQPLGFGCFMWCLFDSGLGPILGYTAFVGVTMAGLLLPTARFFGGVLLGSTAISFPMFLWFSLNGWVFLGGGHVLLPLVRLIGLLSGFDKSSMTSGWQPVDVLLTRLGFNWHVSYAWIGIPLIALAWVVKGPMYAVGAGAVFAAFLLGAFNEAGIVALLLVAFAAFRRWSGAQRPGWGA